jgi:hypothetical protein
MINNSGLDRVVLYLENGHKPMAELHHFDGSVNIIHWDNINERKTYFDPFFTAYVKFEDIRFVKEPEKFFYDVQHIAEGITLGVFETTEECAEEIARFCDPKLWDEITEEDSYCGSPSIILSSKRKKISVDHIDRKVELSREFYALRMEGKSENAEKMQEIKREYFDLLNEDQKLAIILHDKFCKLTNECYWCYEISCDAIHDFNGNEHSEYLQKARDMLNDFSYEAIIKMINIMPN